MRRAKGERGVHVRMVLPSLGSSSLEVCCFCRPTLSEPSASVPALTEREGARGAHCLLQNEGDIHIMPAMTSMKQEGAVKGHGARQAMSLNTSPAVLSDR